MTEKKRTSKCGLQAWIDEYKKSSVTPEEFEIKLLQELKTVTSEEKKKIRDLRDPSLDSDGFRTARSKRRISISSRNSMHIKIKQPKIVTDFYKFQKTEAKKNKLEEIRKQFEEDKKRVSQMREARVFHPL
ncbi:putative Ribosomal RNA-processing protein 7 (RRP7) C-terminal domain [Monocercomonoides exilis]|uniref:putative Ribosomal RNA-processing protein 7 (RRP7) C-terminal domain n=1 Tax=Monocercomonoides exilis TaxID=2049356 RepID=UPI00355A85BF|nr:putative Ribosomal RNA-processing protein 7 (RRP7) C-terminal domain [Monocercomonoides exilis]